MLLGEGEAQPEIEAAVARRIVVANGRAAAPGEVVPAAAARYAVRPTRCTSKIGLSSTAITVIPVLTPLPYIATHVI